MRILKKKRIRKKINWFKTTYRVEAPFKIVVDPLFLKEALDKKIFVKEEIPKLLQDKAYMVISNCIYREIKELGEPYSGVAIMAKRLQRINCSHEEAPVSSKKCILSLTTGPIKYVMAIQSKKFRTKLREIPGVPLLYINPKKKLTFEKISKTSIEYNHDTSISKLEVPEEEKVLLEKEKMEIEKEQESQQIKKVIPTQFIKKRAKGPNPLSIKKKKKKKKLKRENTLNNNEQQTQKSKEISSSIKKKKTRKRKKKTKEQSNQQLNASENREN